MTKINIFSPFVLFTLVFTLYIYAPYLYYMVYPSPFLLHQDEISKFFPFITILLIQIIIFILNKKKYKPKDKFFFYFKRELVFIVVNILLAIVSYKIFWIFNNAFGFFSIDDIAHNIMKYRLTVERDVGFLVMIKKLINITIFTISIVSIYSLKYSNLRYRKTIIFLLLINTFLLMYFSFLSGSRFEFLYVLLIIFYSLYGEDRGKQGISILYFLLIIGIFLTIFSLYSLFRQSVDISSSDRDIFFELIRRFDAIYPNFYLFLDSNLSHNLQYGASYFYLIVSFVPRFFIPDKPLNTQSFFNDHLKYNDAGLDFGVFSELWWNFGYASFIFITIYFVLLYIFFRNIYHHFIANDLLYVPMYLFLIINLTYFIASPINSTNVLFLIVYSIIIFFLSKFFAKFFMIRSFKGDF